MTQLPDRDGKAWAASGRIAGMWLTLVRAKVRAGVWPPKPDSPGPPFNCRCVLPKRPPP